MTITVFEHNVPQYLDRGFYQYIFIAGSGSAIIELGDDNGNFIPMKDGVIPSDKEGTINVSSFPIRVQLSGDAVFSISKIRHDV